MKRGYIDRLRHKMNPLHVYCRLIDVGFEKENAREVSKAYEDYFFGPLEHHILGPLYYVFKMRKMRKNDPL